MPSPHAYKGKVNPSIDKVLRELTEVAFESGYGELSWIERLKTKNLMINLNVMLGISREECNTVMLDELTTMANKIRRERDLKDAHLDKH